MAGVSAGVGAASAVTEVSDFRQAAVKNKRVSKRNAELIDFIRNADG
jgi:hypothetical protein